MCIEEKISVFPQTDVVSPSPWGEGGVRGTAMTANPNLPLETRQASLSFNSETSLQSGNYLSHFRKRIGKQKQTGRAVTKSHHHGSAVNPAICVICLETVASQPLF